MQNIVIAKEGDEHQEQCLFFFRINQFELLNKSHVPSAGFLGWSMAHPDHPLATAVWRTSWLKTRDGQLLEMLSLLETPQIRFSRNAASKRLYVGS